MSVLILSLILDVICIAICIAEIRDMFQCARDDDIPFWLRALFIIANGGIMWAATLLLWPR